MLKPDHVRAIEQRVDQREADGVRLGARGRGAGEPSLAAGQLVVGGDPPLARLRVEGDVLLDGGEAGGEPHLLADAVELGAAEATAERQRL